MFELCQLQEVLLQSLLVSVDLLQFILQFFKGGLTITNHTPSDEVWAWQHTICTHKKMDNWSSLCISVFIFYSNDTVSQKRFKRTYDLPLDRSCPWEKAPLDFLQCPQLGYWPSWSPSRQTLFSRENPGVFILVPGKCHTAHLSGPDWLTTYSVSCPSPHISSLHSQICAETRSHLDSTVRGKRQDRNI